MHDNDGYLLSLSNLQYYSYNISDLIIYFLRISISSLQTDNWLSSLKNVIYDIEYKWVSKVSLKTIFQNVFPKKVNQKKNMTYQNLNWQFKFFTYNSFQIFQIKF